MSDENKELLKPVWRVNNGNGVPSDFGDFAVLKSGAVKGRKRINDWSIMNLSSDVAFYQTTRTRKARYERVECGDCDGDGWIWVTVVHDDSDQSDCENCNGKGYTLEAIE